MGLNIKMSNQEVLSRAKEKTKELIENGEVQLAKELVSKYKDLLIDDVEIYSIRGVIAILEGRTDDGEAILLEGYNIDDSDFDLLYNLGYLYEIKEKYSESLYFYKRAEKYCQDIKLKEEIRNKIKSLKEHNNIDEDIEEKNLKILKKKKKIVFFSKGDDKFIGDIINELSKEYETKKVTITKNEEFKLIDKWMQWADISWFEWCDELVIYGSKLEIAQNKKIICRLHSYEAFTGYPSQVNWNYVDKTVFVAEAIQQFVIDNYKINKEKTIVIPNGVNLNDWTFKPRNHGYKVAYVGYINHKKGPMLLLHVLKALYDKDNRYEFYIAGQFQDPRYALYFKQMVKEIGLEKNFFFEGWQDNLDKWLEDKNYILCTSVLESQNMSVMQAMAKGIKPIIHNFVGAKSIYPQKYIWNTINEANYMVTTEEYNSEEYRNIIEKNYSFEEQMNSIFKLLKSSILNKKSKEISNNFNYEDYWNKRLNAKFDIEGVGYIGLGKTYNKYMYKNRVSILEYLLNNLFDNLENKEVLELGPGIGVFTEYFNSKKIKKYRAIDISRKSVDQLMHMFKDFQFTNGNISDFKNYGANKYDLIFAADVLLHLINENDYKNTIRNISKSLKKDGYVITFDPVSLIGTKSSSPHMEIRDLKYIEQVLEENNLRLEAILPSAFFMNHPFDSEMLKGNNEIIQRVFKLIETIFGSNNIPKATKKDIANWLLFFEREFLTSHGIGLSQKVLVITKKDNPYKISDISIKNVWDMNDIKNKKELYHKKLLLSNHYNVNIIKELDELLDELKNKMELLPQQENNVLRENKQEKGISCSPFFIFGSGRCGTTLLRSILNANEDICIPPENWSIDKIYEIYSKSIDWNILVSKIVSVVISPIGNNKAWKLDEGKLRNKLLNLNTNDRTLPNIINQIYELYKEENFPKATKWGDKTPLNVFNLPIIHNIFGKNAKYINLVRDGRDVVASMLRIKSEGYNVEKACDRWIKSIVLAKEFGEKHRENYIEVRYEDLVCHTEREVKRICNFIGVQFNEDMINFQKDINKNIDKTTLDLNHHKNLQKPINTNSIGKWKDNLTEEQKIKINQWIYKYLIELGYEKDIDIGEKDLRFITSTGRTGTKFL